MAHVTCIKCSHVVLMEERRISVDGLCPKCGEKQFTMTFLVTEQFLPNNTTKITQRDPHSNSKKRVRREHFVGMDANKDGKLMVKERLIDKDANIYYEFVKDPQSGEVIRLCHEKLSDHFGHGSDKKVNENET